MRNAAYDMVYLLSCVLNDQKPELDRLYETDRNKILKMAKFHSITVLIITAFEMAGEDLEKSWLLEREKAVRKSLLMEAEYQVIAEKMEQQGIWYMPMKGNILQSLYQRKGMRQMADIDILFDMKFREQMCDYMQQREYEVKSFGQGNHDVYLKPPVYNFELHVDLYGNAHETAFQGYYRNVKKRLQPVESKQFEFCFTKEDFYIYFISHMYKHFAGSGTGIRSLADCYLFLKKYKAVLDWNYIGEELPKLGLEEFEKQSRQLCFKVFENRTALNKEEESVLEEFLFYGTYGTMQHRVERQVKQLSIEKGIYGAKINYFLQRIFPEKEVLEAYCPAAKKYALLIPYAWGKRIFQSLKLRRHSIVKEINYINKVK